MKKRTKEILSGVLALSIVLSARTPAGMAAAEAVGQQQETGQTGSGGDTPGHGLETIPAVLPEEASADASRILPEEISGNISETLPEEVPEADPENMSGHLTEDTPDALPEEISGETPECILEVFIESGQADLPNVPKSESDIESEQISGNTSEISTESISGLTPWEISGKTPEDGAAMESGSKSGSPAEVLPENSSDMSAGSPDIGPAEPSEDESGTGPAETPESGSDIRSEDQSEPISGEMPEGESENRPETGSGEWSDTKPEKESEDISIADSEAVLEEGTRTEGNTWEDSAGNPDEVMYIKETGSNTAGDTAERDANVPVLRELWVESEHYEAVESGPEEFLVKDFVLKGAFCGTASRIDKIEYTTDLQSENKSVWMEAGRTQQLKPLESETTEPEASMTAFQIALPDGTYPSIAVRAYDEAGNVSGVGQLVSHSGESIKVVVDSTGNTAGMTAQDQSAVIPAIKKTIRLKNINPEVPESDGTNPEIPGQEVITPGISESVAARPGISEAEIVKAETAESSISQQGGMAQEAGFTKLGVTEQEVSKSEVLKAETKSQENVKAETERQAAVKSEEAQQENTKTGLTNQESIRSDPAKKEILRPADNGLAAAGRVGLADNVPEAVQSETFIIDRIAPKMTVDLIPARQTAASTGSNSAVQDSFNTGVTAVIRVTEHNFREEDFAMNMTSVSGKGTWSHDGDVHTLRIPFDGDDVYHIECAYTDLYGNSVKTVRKDFLIDTAAPTITIDGVGSNSANNSAIRPVISVADSNMELSDISVSVMTGTGDLVQSAVDTELINSENGTSYRLTLTDIAEQPDNVYHLNVSARDKAGNVAERTYRFSLNRNGSVYDLTSLRQLVDQKYSTYSALNDIQIVEMNMDSVEEFDLYISRNGALGYKAEYTRETSGSEDVGYTYLYQIKKENFAREGTYRLTMYSRDRAGNEVNNAADINGKEITFVVDNTAPKVVIDGVRSGMVYEAAEQKVHVAVMDNFKLAEAEFILVNEAGEVLGRWDYMALAGEDGALDITIPQYSGKLSLLYRVKDATGNEIQTYPGDAAAPAGFIVNASKPAGMVPVVLPILMTVASVLAVILLMGMAMKKRQKAFFKPGQDFCQD